MRYAILSGRICRPSVEDDGTTRYVTWHQNNTDDRQARAGVNRGQCYGGGLQLEHVTLREQMPSCQSNWAAWRSVDSSPLRLEWDACYVWNRGPKHKVINCRPAMTGLLIWLSWFVDLIFQSQAVGLCSRLFKDILHLIGKRYLRSKDSSVKKNGTKTKLGTNGSKENL